MFEPNCLFTLQMKAERDEKKKTKQGVKNALQYQIAGYRVSHVLILGLCFGIFLFSFYDYTSVPAVIKGRPITSVLPLQCNQQDAATAETFVIRPSQCKRRGIFFFFFF